MKALPLGIMDYRKLITDDYYAVDKSLIIKDFLERKSAVTIITRPRRFGKTLNMSMMAEFFDITKDSTDIFKNTKIMKTKYAENINQYPTIFISFAGAKGTKQSISKSIKLQLRKEYDRYNQIFLNISEFDKDEYKLIKKELFQLTDSTLDNIENALSFLMEQLEKYYQKKVMVFIDEYDTPFIEAHVGGFYNEVKIGLATLLHNALKLSPSLQYAMLTGIQRVAKDTGRRAELNIFSDLNNPIVCTVADKRYSQYFGFTKEETKELLEYYELELNDEVKEMYDGYHIGNIDIYNPWSIINYADRKELIPYWVNTSANMMIRNAIEKSDETFKEGYEALIQNGYLETTVLLETSFYELGDESLAQTSLTEALWGLFINAGYLTIEKNLDIDEYRIRIPNQEVQKEFQSLTAYHINISNTLLSKLAKSLKTGNKDLFYKSYHSILSLPSFYDLTSENSYHMIMLGICAWLSNDYEIISNRESGKGRCDMILKSKKGKQSYVIEFKYAKEETDLESLANKAVEQIEKKKYDEGIIGKIIHIGLAHSKKKISMKWKEKQ